MSFRRLKYRNKITHVDGIRFMSMAEARRYQELKLLERVGKIKLLALQPKYLLAVNKVKICNYIADFSYYDVELKRDVVEDVKGIETPVFKLKAKLFRVLYPFLDFRIVK